MEWIKIKRRMMTLLVVLLVNTSLAIAQTTTKHVVERGETLESIAEKYGVTKDDLVKLNPDAAQFVYVGMELVVPQHAKQEVLVATNREEHSEPSEENVPKSEVPLNTYSSTTIDKFKICIIAGYSLNNYTGKDIKDTKNKGGFHVGLDVRYHVNNMLFVEGMVGIATKGYKQNLFNTSGNGWDDEGPNYDYTDKIKMKTTNLEIPLFFGVNFNGIFLKAGPYFSYALNGKLENDYKHVDYLDIHSAEWDEDTEETKISEMKDFNRLTVGVGAGIGYCYDKFLIQFSYQRGLTKLFDKSKTYEQNLLFSVGYFF